MPPRSKRAHRKKSKAAAPEAAEQIPPKFDTEKIKQLYSTMLGCRMAAERGHLLVKQEKLPGDLGVVAGQEAAEVGALIDLMADDCVALGRRDLTARFIRAAPLKTIFADLYARRAGTGNGLGRPQADNRAAEAMIVPAFSLSAQLNLITGVAWSLKRHGKQNVAVAFSGDDSAALASWRDAVIFSALHKLPIVHIVHNQAGNGSVRASLDLAEEPAARQPNLPAFTVDGNDVVAVYRVAQEAIRRARQGHGPALIECETIRGHGLFDAGTPSLGLNVPEAEPLVDPVARMEAYLQQKGLWSERWKRKLVENFNRKLDQAVEFAERSLEQRRKRMKSKLATAS
jgi:pyruvate dehydrogenase E1 component alpha subunit